MAPQRTSPPLHQERRASQYLPYTYPNTAPSDNPLDVSSVQATGRRSHKVSQATHEVVWPVRLEASLLKALKAYAQAGPCPRPAKRHPKRNRFISEFIVKETGQYRSPKQIGSRIQQLKETCPDAEIQMLINQLGPEEPWPSPPSPTSPLTPDSSSNELSLAGTGYDHGYPASPASHAPNQSLSTISTEYYSMPGPPQSHLGYYNTSPGFYIPPPPFSTAVCQAQTYYAFSDEGEMSEASVRRYHA